jgi:excisionase family DNA binding protein
MTTASARPLPVGPEQGADTHGDAVLRPDPAEVEGAAVLLQGIDVLVGSQQSGRLIGPDGEVMVEIPASVLAAFRLVAAAMAQGQAVTVAPHDMELTTQEAADLLHVSRTHLVKLLDHGDIPHHRTSDDPNAHRRVLLKDVLSYRDQRRRTRRDLLREITQISQSAAGGYR